MPATVKTLPPVKSSLRTFHGDATLKKKLVAEIRKHKKMDQIVKGTYGRENGVWEGCAVGCSIRSLCNVTGKQLATDDHFLYETEFGIPTAIAHLEDAIFESLRDEQAKEFPLRFIKAVPVGADLSPVIPMFLAWLLDDPKDGVIRFADEVGKISIHTVADLHRRSLIERITDEEWTAAWDAASAAASAAAWGAASAAAWDAAWDAQANKLIEIIGSIKS